MTMMDLKGKSDKELDELEFALAMRENHRAVSLIAQFRKLYDKTVKVVKGRKVPKGTTGKCFWIGVTSYAKYADPWGLYDSVRVGIKDEDGEVYWTAADNVEVIA